VSFEENAVRALQIKFEVIIPNAGFVQREITGWAASDPYRKMAGNLFGSRLFAVKNGELDHQIIVFGTVTVSPGNTG
jgi:hypothetical protein